MAQHEDIAIIAAGAVTSVGLSAASTCAAIRASLDNFSETHFIDAVGEPLLGAMVPPSLLNIPQEQDGSTLGGTGKLAAMFVRAATECVSSGGGIDASRTALLLIGPEASRPGFNMAKLKACFDACTAAIGKPFHAASRITQIGSPGLAAALQYAQTLLTESAKTDLQPVQAVLIAGIDSLLNTEDINTALAAERLLSTDNSDGFIPGEAAACVLVTRMDSVAGTDVNGLPRPAVLKVAGTGLAQEADSWISGKPNSGKGLAQAMKLAFAAAGLQPHDIHHRLSDVSGESFFMDEATYAWARVQRAPGPAGYSAMIAGSSAGEVGAASGCLLLALALDMTRKEWAAGANFLLHFTGNGAPRGALIAQAV
jgi:3-oxoacyl-[acyl-carrier-protein] synthase I